VGSEAELFGRELMAQAREIKCGTNERGEIHLLPILARRAQARLARLEDLFDGAEKAVSVFEHDAVEIVALRFIERAAIERFEIEANGGDRRFELVGDRVEEAILLFIAADFADKKDGVEHEAGDDEPEKDDAEDKRDDLTPVENDPTDVEGDRQPNQAGAQGDEEGTRFGAAGDAHGPPKL